MSKKFKNSKTSWQNVSSWYQKHVGIEGNYFHQHIIIPSTLKLLKLNHNSSLLDLGCGQGILARKIPVNINYTGIDISPDLITFAAKSDRNDKHKYLVGDIVSELPLNNSYFTHATVILALQNIEYPQAVIKNCQKHLIKNGKLVLMLNHPCFRIPRQTSWGIDSQNSLQYRKINRYMSPLKIPVTVHPGMHSNSPITWSFHYPLSAYSKYLYESGFVIELIEEYSSDRESEGKASRMENRARAEIPLFMGILASKI